MCSILSNLSTKAAEGNFSRAIFIITLCSSSNVLHERIETFSEFIVLIFR